MYIVYFLLWLIFNGRVNSEVIIIGIIISLLLDLFVKRCLKIEFSKLTFLSSIWKFIKLFPYGMLYVIVLLIEIVRANFSIIKLVLAPEIDVEPCIKKFNTKLQTEAARVALANSITLTPGTITVSLEGNELLVHALNRNFADGLEGSIFEKILSRMERKIYA